MEEEGVTPMDVDQPEASSSEESEEDDVEESSSDEDVSLLFCFVAVAIDVRNGKKT